MGRVSVTRSMKWSGIGLILLVGAIHFLGAPDSFSEALYKGLLFTANGVGAIVAAVGISLDRRDLGWALGALVAAGAFIGYLTSRTVGLPGLGVDEWFEPIGMLSLAAEGLFLLAYLRVFVVGGVALAGDRSG